MLPGIEIKGRCIVVHFEPAVIRLLFSDFRGWYIVHHSLVFSHILLEAFEITHQSGTYSQFLVTIITMNNFTTLEKICILLWQTTYAANRLIELTSAKRHPIDLGSYSLDSCERGLVLKGYSTYKILSLHQSQFLHENITSQVSHTVLCVYEVGERQERQDLHEGCYMLESAEGRGFGVTD